MFTFITIKDGYSKCFFFLQLSLRDQMPTGASGGVTSATTGGGTLVPASTLSVDGPPTVSIPSTSSVRLSNDRTVGREEVTLCPGEVKQEFAKEVTYLCPYTGPKKGILTVTNYRLHFYSIDTDFELSVPLGVVSNFFLSIIILQIIL